MKLRSKVLILAAAIAVFAVSILLTLSAFADVLVPLPIPAVTAAPGGTMNLTLGDSLSAFAIQAVTLLAPVLLAGLAYLGKQLVSYIQAHVKNAQVAGVMTRLEAFAEMIVRNHLQTGIADLRKDLADGKITKGDFDQALEDQKSEALDELKSLMGRDGINELFTILGLDSSGLGTLLNTVLESVLHKVKLDVSMKTPATLALAEAIPAGK